MSATDGESRRGRRHAARSDDDGDGTGQLHDLADGDLAVSGFKKRKPNDVDGCSHGRHDAPHPDEPRVHGSDAQATQEGLYSGHHAENGGDVKNRSTPAVSAHQRQPLPSLPWRR